MELYSIRLSDRVYTDLTNISEYAESKLNVSSKKFLEKFNSSLETIRLFPYSNPLFMDWRGEQFRKLVLFKKYTFMYKVNDFEQEIEVYRIFHQSEDWFYKIYN